MVPRGWMTGRDVGRSACKPCEFPVLLLVNIGMQYWYSSQLRNYRLQFIRAFSNFYVKSSRPGPDGTGELIRVPCRYGDPSRIAASIVKGNSENKMLSAPFITCFISGLNLSANRRQDPQLIETVQVNERRYDAEAGRYTNEIGNRYTVQRYMPVPYDLTMQVDMWTDNLSIKEQLLEQILVLYNPAIDLQTSVNPLDWTVLTIIEMQDSINWSSRSIPIGTEDPIDVATINFKLPIWINPPAKVKKQSIIHQIVANIVEGEKNPAAMEWTEYEFLARNITTPDDATIKVSPRQDGRFDLSLCNRSLLTTDADSLPTVTFASQNPSLFSGMRFSWNGRICTISNTNINNAVEDIRSALSNSDLNCVVFNETSLQLINSSGGDNDLQDVVPGTLAALGIEPGVHPGGNLAWWRLLQLYGTVRQYSTYGSNASQIRLKTVDDIEQTSTDIIGWFDYDPLDQNKLTWTPDPQSYPAATLAPMDAIVNPQTSGPNLNLPPAAVGQRYLLTETAPDGGSIWGSITAGQDEIVQFDGARWNVAWGPSDDTGIVHHIMNNRSGRMYRWANGYWSPVIGSSYRQGYWRVAL